MSRAFLSSLRGRLLLLVLLATVPAFALLFYTSWRERQVQANAVVQNTVRLARGLANDQERIIEGTRQILSDLAGLSELRTADPARTRTLFTLLMKQWRGYASFALIDNEGRPLVSLPEGLQALDFSDRPWFQRARRSGGFTIGEYQVGQVSGKQILVAAHPVVADGQVQSVIAAALDVEWLNQIASTAHLPAGSVLSVVDRAGAIVARYPDGADWVGRRMAESAVLGEMAGRAEGSVHVTSADGAEQVFAFTPVKGRFDTGLRLVIAVPRETAYGPLNRQGLRQLAGLLFVAALTLVLAWVGAERLVLRRAAALLEATRRLAAGDPAARTQLPYGQGELSDLARAFDEMASAVQAREAERARAEQALRESEDRFRAFMQHTPAIAYVKDEEGRRLFANAAFERYFGLRRDDWFGRTDEELWPESPAVQTFRSDDLRVLATNEPHQTLETLVLPGGRVGHWMTVKFPLTEATGRRLIGGVSVDLTDWRLAQAALARSERRFEQLVEQAWDAIVLIDADRRLLSVNSAACTMTGYGRDELLGMRLDDLVVREEPLQPPLLARVIGSGELVVAERKVRRKDGSTCRVELTARAQESGHIQAVVRDVTARHAAQEALRESEERYRLLYRYLPLAYQSLTEDGAIVEVNEAWLSLTGLTREAAIGSRFDALLHPDSRLRFLESLARVARAGEVHDVEVVLLRRDGAAVMLTVDLRGGSDERQRPRIHCVLDDVTDARAAAARLRESEERYRSLFADSPVPLFEEDFSGIKRHLERLDNLGVNNLEAHFAAHPEELADCLEAVRVVDVNKATLALYRADNRNQLLAGLERIIGPDGHDVFEAAILALARGERSWRSEGFNYTLDGDRLRVSLQWSLAPGAERDWSRVLVSAIDISERSVAEAALQEADVRFARAFLSSPLPMAISTLSGGRLVDVNEAFVQQFGYTRDTLIGRTTSEVGLYGDGDRTQRFLQRLAGPEGERGLEVSVRARDGRLVHGLWSGIPLPLDGRDCLLAQMVDISSHRRAEEAERESRRMLSLLIGNLPGMVYQCCDDPEWTMLFVSDGCRELTGYESSDLVGNRRLSFARLIVEEDREAVQAEVRQAIAERRVFRCVYRLRTADGNVKWVSEHGRAGQTADGQVLTLEGFVAEVAGPQATAQALLSTVAGMTPGSTPAGPER